MFFLWTFQKLPMWRSLCRTFFFFFLRNKQNLFNYKDIQPKFQIEKNEDAINQLSQLLNHITPNPILLILDDVWLGSEPFLPENFKFDLSKYKILVTSRTAFPRFEFTYHLEPLNDEDAMTLFRHSASLKEGSTYIPPEEDIKKVLCLFDIYIYIYMLNFICLISFCVRYVEMTEDIYILSLLLLLLHNTSFNYIIPYVPVKIMLPYIHDYTYI